MLTSAAFHYGTNPPFSHQYVTSNHTAAEFGAPVSYPSGFHTYSVEWNASSLRFFVNDVNWYTVYNSDVGNFLSHQTAGMATILNTAVGGDFFPASGQPDATSVWPQQFKIDYVRVYDRDDSPVKFVNGNFEVNNGSLAQWSVFGNRVNTNNVSVHNEAVEGGAASLKLFGQFTGGNNSSGASQGISVSAGDEVHAAASRFIRSADTISGTGNSVQMKIEFFNQFGGKSDSSAEITTGQKTLTIANGSSPNDAWLRQQVSATAPAGAVEARLSLVFLQSGNQGGAVHLDDVSFLDVNTAATCDFNLDGVVDGADLAAWQAGFGTDAGATRAQGDANGDGAVDGADFLAWQQQASVLPSALAATAASAGPIPEPGAIGLAAIACGLTAAQRRSPSF